MTRKSPVKHEVSSYTREGRKVSSHTRGSGYLKSRERKRVAKRFMQDTPMKEPKLWVVTYTYKSSKKESVNVIAMTYDKALDEAFEERKYQNWVPTNVNIDDPDLLGFIKKTLSVPGKVAGASARAAKWAGSGIGRQAKFTVEEQKVMHLLRNAYSDDARTKLSARIALKRIYPEYYELADFSRERN